MPDDRGRLGQVEPLALGQALDDVDEDHVGEAGLGDPLRDGGAHVPGADDGDLVSGHEPGAPSGGCLSGGGSGPGILARVSPRPDRAARSSPVDRAGPTSVGGRDGHPSVDLVADRRS